MPVERSAVPECLSDARQSCEGQKTYRCFSHPSAPRAPSTAACTRSARPCRMPRTGCSCADRPCSASSGCRLPRAARGDCRTVNTGTLRGTPSDSASWDLRAARADPPASALPWAACARVPANRLDNRAVCIFDRSLKIQVQRVPEVLSVPGVRVLHHRTDRTIEPLEPVEPFDLEPLEPSIISCA